MKPVIFFDWDGTLADSMNLCVAEIRQALITMRLPDLPDDVLRQCNGPTFEQSLDILHIPHDRAQEYMTTRLTAELALVPTVNRLFPGVREMLQTLREYADLCIVSNGEHDYIALCLQVFGLTDVFVRTATSVPGRTKGENLRALLDALRPERAVMVGDRMDTDVISGLESGMSTVLVLSGVSTEETLKTYAYRPSIVLPGVGDIAAMARREKA